TLSGKGPASLTVLGVKRVELPVFIAGIDDTIGHGENVPFFALGLPALMAGLGIERKNRLLPDKVNSAARQCRLRKYQALFGVDLPDRAVRIHIERLEVAFLTAKVDDMADNQWGGPHRLRRAEGPEFPSRVVIENM